MHDIVPSLPPTLLGYHHVSHEIFQKDVVDPATKKTCKTYTVCDGSGEDPKCHASMCSYGLCRSMSDHTTYLGIAMHSGGVVC